MFRLIRWSFYLLIIAGIVTIFVMWNGGDKIRWIGRKSEEVGKAIREKTEAIGDKSDRVREEILEKKEQVEDIIEKAEKIGVIVREENP